MDKSVKLRNKLIEISEKAAEIILIEKQFLTIEEKANSYKHDLVTSADLAVEDYIVDTLNEEFPEYNIISEEKHNKNNKSNKYFVIDPIDGTINFANGFPYWGIQIACVENGNTIASVINMPDLNNIYSADLNNAYLNNEVIHVSDLSLKDGLYSIEGVDRVIGRKELISNDFIHLRELYSVCSSFSYVASGVFVASVYNYKYIWDWKPGEFIVRQAGGVSFLDYDRDIYFVANNNENLNKFVEIFDNIRRN